MTRLGWVRAFPSEDRRDVRAIVAEALEVGFDQIVLQREDERLGKLGRFSPILLKNGAVLFRGGGNGRVAAARAQGGGTRPLVEVHDAAEAKLFFETMEVGVDGILLASPSPKDVRAVRHLFESAETRIGLLPAKVPPDHPPRP